MLLHVPIAIVQSNHGSLIKLIEDGWSGIFWKAVHGRPSFCSQKGGWPYLFRASSNGRETAYFLAGGYTRWASNRHARRWTQSVAFIGATGRPKPQPAQTFLCNVYLRPRLRITPIITGVSDTTIINIVTTPKWFLTTGILPNKYPPQINSITQEIPPARL